MHGTSRDRCDLVRIAQISRMTWQWGRILRPQQGWRHFLRRWDRGLAIFRRGLLVWLRRLILRTLILLDPPLEHRPTIGLIHTIGEGAQLLSADLIFDCPDARVRRPCRHRAVWPGHRGQRLVQIDLGLIENREAVTSSLSDYLSLRSRLDSCRISGAHRRRRIGRVVLQSGSHPRSAERGAGSKSHRPLSEAQR